MSNEKIIKLLDSCREIEMMLDHGDIQDATMLSGEKLAQADKLWTDARNSNSPTIDEITALSIIASYHCESLAMMGNEVDAYSTSIMVLFQIAFDESDSQSLDKSRLQLYITAVMSLIRRLDSGEFTADEYSRSHMNHIMRYLVSMLYHYYNKVGKHSPEFPHLDVAYRLLSQLKDMVAIDRTRINVIDEQIDPEKPIKLFGDLIGRSKALGLLS